MPHQTCERYKASRAQKCIEGEVNYDSLFSVPYLYLPVPGIACIKPSVKFQHSCLGDLLEAS